MRPRGAPHDELRAASEIPEDARYCMEAIRAMTVSDERARATIGFREAWGAVARRLGRRPDPDLFRLLEQVAVKAGHAGLVVKVLREGIPPEEAR